MQFFPKVALSSMPLPVQIVCGEKLHLQQFKKHSASPHTVVLFAMQKLHSHRVIFVGLFASVLYNAT